MKNPEKLYFAICRKSLQIGFREGVSYPYEESIHSETQLKLYYLKTDDGIYLPMTEKRFKENFDNRQVEREKKIDKILKS